MPPVRRITTTKAQREQPLTYNRRAAKRSEQEVEASRKFPCPELGCALVYTSEGSLTRHWNANHDPNFLGYQCKFCEHICSQKAQLKVHENTHTKEQEWACSHCSYKGPSPSALSKHKSRPGRCKKYLPANSSSPTPSLTSSSSSSTSSPLRTPSPLHTVPTEPLAEPQVYGGHNTLGLTGIDDPSLASSSQESAQDELANFDLDQYVNVNLDGHSASASSSSSSPLPTPSPVHTDTRVDPLAEPQAYEPITQAGLIEIDESPLASSSQVVAQDDFANVNFDWQGAMKDAFDVTYDYGVHDSQPSFAEPVYSADYRDNLTYNGGWTSSWPAPETSSTSHSPSITNFGHTDAVSSAAGVSHPTNQSTNAGVANWLANYNSAIYPSSWSLKELLASCWTNYELASSAIEGSLSIYDTY